MSLIWLWLIIGSGLKYRLQQGSCRPRPICRGELSLVSADPSILSALDACGTVLDRNKYAPPSALAVECLAMAYHGHIRFSNPRLLELVKTAAGRHGSGQDCLVARQALVDIFRSDQVLQRVILVYSAMLLCLLGRYVSE